MTSDCCYQQEAETFSFSIEPIERLHGRTVQRTIGAAEEQ